MLITDPTKLREFYADRRVWQGIPGIARTKGGRTFVSIYSGDVKETYGNYVFVIKSDNDHDFSDPIVAAQKEGKFRCFDPVLWIDPLGRLWFIWNVMPGEEVYASICEDPDADELIWSEEFYIGRGIMMNKPIVLSTGEWLFPIAIWKLDIYNNYRKSALTPDDVAGAYVYKTSDNGKTFVRLGSATHKLRSFDEHMVMEKDNGVLWMLIRLHTGIGESYSYDRGKTWSQGHTSSLGGPSSRFHIYKLRSGRVLLINHYKFNKRNNLTALLSEDDGKTFPYTLLLDERDQVSYPDAIECDDGYIYITYDRERGCYKNSLEEAYADAREILTAKITEDDIINGRLVSEGSFLKNVVSKLDRLADDCVDPFSVFTPEDAEFAHMLIESGETDPVGKIFETYFSAAYCISEYDSKPLDDVIKRLHDSGCNDEETLMQIIAFYRNMPKHNEKVYPVIEAVKTYVSEHYTENFTVSDIAKHMNMSVYYLSHLFKAIVGTSILEYRDEIRLTNAKKELISTEKAIGDIAQEMGYCSSAYFSEVFAKSENVSPTEYRKYHKHQVK